MRSTCYFCRQQKRVCFRNTHTLSMQIKHPSILCNKDLGLSSRELRQFTIQNKFDISKCTIAVKGNNTSDALQKHPQLFSPEDRKIEQSNDVTLMCCMHTTCTLEKAQCHKYSAYKTIIHTLTAYSMHRGRPLSICSPAEIHIKAHCTWAQSAHFRKPNHTAQIHSSCTRGLYALCRKFTRLKCRFHLITLMRWFALSLWGTPQYIEQWVWGPSGPHVGSTPTVRKPLIAFNSLPKWAQTLLGLIPQSQLQTSNYPGCCVRTITGLHQPRDHLKVHHFSPQWGNLGSEFTAGGSYWDAPVKAAITTALQPYCCDCSEGHWSQVHCSSGHSVSNEAIEGNKGGQDLG